MDIIEKNVLFSLTPHPLQEKLCDQLNLEPGSLQVRRFPDGESYLRVLTSVKGANCVILADLTHPDTKYLALLFLFETLRELGARSIGLVAPYLCYMRQDRRFEEGEAVTSRVFAQSLSLHIDWLITVDPHLHRYQSLDEIYSIPTQVVQGAPALADWLRGQNGLLLVGPDAESEQWVSSIAQASNHPYVIGTKQRLGDRRVEVTLRISRRITAGKPSSLMTLFPADAPLASVSGHLRRKARRPSCVRRCMAFLRRPRTPTFWVPACRRW